VGLKILDFGLGTRNFEEEARQQRAGEKVQMGIRPLLNENHLKKRQGSREPGAGVRSLPP
jgi:hypothetical protein